jgi:beta propeller repeat protein
MLGIGYLIYQNQPVSVLTCDQSMVLIDEVCCFDEDEDNVCDEVAVELEIVEMELMPLEVFTPETEENDLVLDIRPLTLDAVALGCDEVQITTDESDQFGAAIHEDYVVWNDERNGNRDIYLYDLESGDEVQLTTDESDQQTPTVYGERAAWVDMSDGQHVYVYDLESEEGEVVTSGNQKYQTPELEGNNLVYGYHAPWSSGTRWNVFLYDLVSDEGRVVYPDKGEHQYLPSIDESKIAWLRDGNVFLFDVFVRQITQSSTVAGQPVVSGSRVVWQDEINGNWDVYMYDLDTGSHYQITNEESDQMNPAIYGDKIVWQDDREGDWDVYELDLSTGVEEVVSAAAGDQTSPRIFENTIVWEDERSGNRDIYGYVCR